MATDSQACPDSSPHGPHTWYSPSTERGKSGQDQHNCPGVPKR